MMFLTFCVSYLQVLGYDNTLTYEPWPEHDEAFLVEDSIKLPVQVCYCLLLMLTKSCRTKLCISKQQLTDWHA